MIMPCIAQRLGLLLAACCLLGTASIAAATLTIIFDNGQARPLSDFLGPLAAGEPDAVRPGTDTQPLGAAHVRSLLPIRSPGLTPGPVTPRAYSAPFAQAFFLIGSDAISKRWLKQHKDALKHIGAVGLLVEASSVEDLQAMAELADGLPITPASGSDIGDALGIDHYPVAISGGRIWQ